MLLGLLDVVFECCFGNENWNDLIGVVLTLNCSKHQCLVPRKRCIIALISRNPSE